MKWVSTVKKLVEEKAKAVAEKAKAVLKAVKSSVVKVAVVGAVGMTVALGSSVSYAATTVDLTSITGAVSAGDITTGVLAIGAVMAVVHMTIKAAKIVLGVLKGG